MYPEEMIKVFSLKADNTGFIYNINGEKRPQRNWDMKLWCQMGERGKSGTRVNSLQSHLFQGMEDEGIIWWAKENFICETVYISFCIL